MLERVQKRFLRYISFKRLHFNTNTTIIYIESIQCNLSLSSRLSRRKLNDATFVYKLINGHISCPSLLELIPFHIPRFNSRLCPTFHEKTHRTNYGYNNPLDRMFRECNKIDSFDFFIPNSLPALRRIFLNIS